MKVIAISACPTGIAHTFMVAGKLEEWGKKSGNEVKVETQGSDGQKNKLTKSDIASADAIILAVDVPIDGEERFEGKKVYKVKTQEFLKNFDTHIEKAMKMQNETSELADEEEKKESAWEIISGHIMSGISFMIPIIVLGGLLIAAGSIAQQFMAEEAYVGSVWEQFNMIGGMTMKLMYPFFAGYLAYSIAGKPALAPAFVGGLMTDQLYGKYFGLDPYIPSGFFGAIAIGFLVGYLVRYLNNTIKVREDFTTIKTMLIVPLVSGVVMVVAMVYVINPLCTVLNTALYNFFTWAGTAGALFYSTVIAAGTAFDLGGPINKAAGAVALGFNGTSEAFDLTARTLAIIIPPIGIGFSAWIQRPMKKKIYTPEKEMFAKTALMLGVCGVSEGAIPFILANPKLIISNITGAIVGSWVAILLGASQTLPLPAIWGWPLATNPMAYVTGLAVGALTVAVLTIILSPRVSE